MDFSQLPFGNNQEVYFDPDELYIKPEWIDQKLHCVNMPDLPLDESNPVYEAYKKLFEKLFEKGYKVVTDSRFVKKDTFCFTPCLDKHINRLKEDYELKKNNKIQFYLNNEGITKPLSVSFPLDSFPTSLPSLPFVLKNENNQGGKEKFLIETSEQVAILKRFYNEINIYDRQRRIEEAKRQWDFIEDLEFDEKGHSNSGICVHFVDYKKEFHLNMRVQKFIKTPTKYNTSLRVLTSASKDILAASIKYSNITSMPLNKKEKYYGLFDRYLNDPLSPYFIDSKSIVSNTVSGGNSILLGKDNYSELEQEILLAHGISPNKAFLPQDVKNACINIAEQCNHEIGAICGMDFIYDKEENAWKYLEEHEYPMLYSYAEKYQLPYDLKAKDFYTVNKLLDLKVRLHALILTMQKKELLFDNKERTR